MKDRIILITLLLVQLILCLLVINKFPIALDEPFSIFHAQLPLNDMLDEIGKGNNSPLHFILLHFWIKLFGIGAVSVRMLSVLVSLLTIFVLYKLGRKFLSQQNVIILCGLFIFSRLDHLIAMEARMYGLFTLFFVLILFELYRFIFENKRVFIQLGIWNALLLYTHYLGGVVLVMELAVFFAFYKFWTPKKWLDVGLTVVIGALLFIPGITIFLSRATEFSAVGTWVPEATFTDLWTNLVKLLNNQFTLIVGFVLVLALIFGGKKLKKKEISRELLKFFLLWFLGAYSLMFIISLIVQPIFIVRYLQFLTVPLLLVFVCFIAQYQWSKKLQFVPFLILVPFALSFKPIPDTNREIDKMITYVKENKTDETVVYYSPPHYNLTIAYHYDSDLFQDYTHLEQNLLKERVYGIYNQSDIDTSEQFKKLVFIDFESGFLYPDNGIIPFLDLNYSFIAAEHFAGGFVIYQYQNE